MYMNGLNVLLLRSSKVTRKDSLQIEPAAAFGNKDALEARMIHQPDAGLQTVMTAEIICEKENIPSRIVGLDVLEEFDGVLGIAGSGTTRVFFAITHPQGSRGPDVVIAATVCQGRLDTMTIG